MKELSLSAINARSTLPVSLTGGGSFTFSFKDDSFIVGFVKDFTILDEGVYQFFIESKNKANTSGNKDVRKTIISIIEEFFSENDSAILYIYAILMTTGNQFATDCSQYGSIHQRKRQIYIIPCKS